MEFNFNIEKAIGNISNNGICFLDGRNYQKYNKQTFSNLCFLLDTIGNLSAKAQQLKSVITTGIKFFGSDHRIYLKCQGNIFIGFIKVGKKHLFIYDELGQITEMNPLCVLDFYVYENCQRSGNGKIIYSEMINRENIEPRKLGYDRPSIKFINFLKKYYNLYDYVPQNNNYIVFKDYFYDEKKMGNNNNYQNSNLNNIYYGGYNNSNYSNTMKNNYNQKYNYNQQNLDNYYYQNNFYDKYSDSQKYQNNPYSKTQQIQNEYLTQPKENYYQNNTFNNTNNQPYSYNLQNNNFPVIQHRSYFDTFVPNSKYRYQSSSSEYGSFLNYDKK